MRRNYIFFGVVLVLGSLFFLQKSNLVFGQAFNQDGDDCFMTPADERCTTVIYSPGGVGGGMSSGGGSATTSTAPKTVGVLNFSPSSVKDGGSFSIKLSGADSVPSNTVTRLWIDPENTGSFKNFGTWLTVGELRSGVSRKLTCSSYSSYDPAGPRNITGKNLNQRIFVSYEGLDFGSEISLHTKDCSSAGSGGTTTPSAPSGGSAGSAACLVSPGSAAILPNGTVSFKVSSNKSTSGGEYVYVAAKDFTTTGVYADTASGRVIPPGATSVDFKVYALNSAVAGAGTFKVYCTTGCSAYGCPSGGSAEVIGVTTVNLAVGGNNLPSDDQTPPVGSEQSTCTVANNPAGKVRLTANKNIFDSLFPKSACNEGLSNCRNGFWYTTPISVISDFANSFLVGADVIRHPPRSNTAHPRLFSLADPMSPKIEPSSGGEINSAQDAFGDYGATFYPRSPVYSRDRSVWAMSSNGNSAIYVWKNGQRYAVPFVAGKGELSGIIKYGSRYILLTSWDQSFDITDGMKVDDSGLYNERFSYSLVPAPVDFPRLPSGDKFILGNDQYILTVNNDWTPKNVIGRKVMVYSPTEKDVVAQADLPQYLGSGSQESYGVIPVSGADYIYFIRSPKSSPEGSHLLNVYKFDYGTKKLAEVAKDVLLEPGSASVNAAFGANSSNPGIVVFGKVSSGSERKIQVYLLADILRGVGIDVMSNSSVCKIGPTNARSIASFSSGNSTYVYTNDAEVYKLEYGAASGGVANPPTTTPPGDGGATPTYDCAFDLSFAPADLSVKQGTYYANYTIKANSTSVNPFCTINVIPPSQNSIKSDYISTLLVSPGGQTTMLLNVSKAAKGAYILPVKASAKGVPAKTYNVSLTVY